ncbi:hypothetical protein [Ramlibacter rhizophilus]|uniref:Integral membrane protein n=1 Tax=Ramlibacter rhizophilus TaxID=1781167 RepID=A0A4Z0BE51_9BURK|nr:hypothetical protein [Ramlibacter rhizophilus]TFY96961.1 hypothetical protein EZ242_20075 [Ramlibacter rhizophilus]
MSVFASPRFLRQVLLVDAAACLATGALQLGLTSRLAEALALPGPLLASTGAFLLGYAALAAWVASRQPVPTGWVTLFVAGNAAWGVACIGLLAAGVLAPNAWGQAWVLAQALTVIVLAELQWLGLRARRARPLAA